MTDFGLLQPAWLLLLPVFLFWLYRRKTPLRWPDIFPTLSLRYPLLDSVDLNASEQASEKKSAPVSVVLSFVLIVVALTQPVHYTKPIELRPEASELDVVFVVGTAISMRLKDYVIDEQPKSRMEMAKLFLDGFAESFSGERMGLVVLGSPPALWLPLTPDRRAIRDALARLRPVLGGRLADMGAALKLVETHYESKREKIVVMVTDGGLQLGETAPEVAASRIAGQGYTLYVLGVGGAEGQTVARDPGSLIYQSLNLEFLQGIAEAGGGEFFHIQNAAAFQDALKIIEAQHQANTPDGNAPRLRLPLYPWFVGLAMLLIMLSFVGGIANSKTNRQAS